MKIIRRQPRIVSQKILANVSENFARAFRLPEGHRNVGFFSTDNDDIAYIAADDATKKARIQVQTSVTYYGGSMFSEYDYTGTVFILFSSEHIQDVKSAMGYIRDFVDNYSELYCFDGDRGTGFYAQTIARAGSFFRDWANVPEGQAYAYLVGAPVETNLALDKGCDRFLYRRASPGYGRSHGLLGRDTSFSLMQHRFCVMILCSFHNYILGGG